jgi:hypothetical protein
MKRLLFLPLLALPLLFMSCEGQMPTDPEATSNAGDILLRPAVGNYGVVVKYYHDACTSTANQVGVDWTYPSIGSSSGRFCLVAQVTNTVDVTRGRVTWYACRATRQSGSPLLPKADCVTGDGHWVPLSRQAVDSNGEVVQQGVWDRCGFPRTIGYKYVFKGGGQVQAGESVVFDVTPIDCPT